MSRRVAVAFGVKYDRTAGVACDGLPDRAGESTGEGGTGVLVLVHGTSGQQIVVGDMSNRYSYSGDRSEVLRSVHLQSRERVDQLAA